MLTERRRVLGLLRDRALTTLWLGRFAEQLGTWTFVFTLLVVAWTGTGSVVLVCWVLAAFFIPRLVVTALLEPWLRRMPPRALPMATALQVVIALAAAVLVTRVSAGFNEVLIGSAAAMGFLTAVSNETRGSVVRDAVRLPLLGTAVLAHALIDRAALLLGVLIGAAVLSFSVTATLAASAVLFAAAAALSLSGARGDRSVPATGLAGGVADGSDVRLVARRTAVYVVAAFTGGALGAVLIVSVPLLAAPTGNLMPATAGLLLGAAALGMLIGPLPVPRMLLRVPAALLLLATVVVTAAVALFVVITQSAVLAVGAYLVFGLASVTQDALRAIAIRRLVPAADYERVARFSRLALTIGQLYGALGVVSIASADPFAILGLLAISQVLLAGAGVALGGRDQLRIGGLSALPINSVVHQLSWETNPDPMPVAAFHGAEPRIRRLAEWIERQAELQQLSVTLPISRREYAIYRPDDDSRERLFDAGRADPEKQMPYWAKVWPSGVALADVVVERKAAVAGSRVLELGAGLGVTACVVLEYGGRIVTADYSALPLAYCRLNTLINTGRAPRATCFNWRREAEVAATMKQHEFRDGFPLIIAGDVLYEGRDAEPLLNVIERMLTADGSVWLAEPVRRTAQRFLDSAAALGWEIESRQVRADWPDATSGPVNLHFLKRSAEPDRIVSDLGGWRI